MSKNNLDARHLLCPMPVIKLQKAMTGLMVGDVLHMVCTDPGVKYDVPAWVRVHGHRVLASNAEQAERDEEIFFEIEKCDS